MRKIKKIISLLLICMIFIVQVLPVSAQEDSNDEWYEMVEEDFEMVESSGTEISPYTLYIMDVVTSLVKLSSSKVGLRADVLCSSTMNTITVTFYLQKYTGSSWKNVSSGVTSSSNVAHAIKQMTASGLSSGTYRAKAVAMVRDSSGYAETFTGYSGSLKL
ncbi:MAG: hypothetical protein ACI4DX_03195 [Oliverpabstia sp.]